MLRTSAGHVLASRARAAGLSRDALLGVIALVAAIVAVTLMVRGWNRGPEIPTDESTWVFFDCKACKARFHLNGQELEAELQRLSNAGKGKSLGPVRCTQCGEAQGVRVDDELAGLKAQPD